MTIGVPAGIGHSDHALLVGLGMFEHRIGLFDALDKARFPGRVYRRSPQRKLRELLAALAAGYRDLQAIDLAPDALRADPLVLAVWDADGFAHYTNVSRGIRRTDTLTVSDLQTALEQVSAPFLARDLEEVLATGSPLRLEGDTTGLATTAKMPGVEPGLIDGRLQPGFQMASVSLRTPRYRVMLGSAHFNGKTVSCQTLEALLQLAERRVGRPQRRVELLYTQLDLLQQEETRWRDKAQRAQARAAGYEERAWALHFVLGRAEQEIAHLQAQQGGREVRPHSRLAQANRHRQVYQRWQASAQRPDQGRLLHGVAPADIDELGAGFHRPQLRLADPVPGLAGEAHREHDHVPLRKHRQQLVGAVHLCHARRLLFGVAPNAQHAHAQGSGHFARPST